MKHQQGNVLAEAILIFGVLVGLLTAVHLSGRWQFQWLGHHLDIQTKATALALEHRDPSRLEDTNQRPLVKRGQQLAQAQVLAEQAFRLGENHWLVLQRQTSFKQHAWRLVGTGHAATDQDVTKRLTNAKQLWMQTHRNSQQIVARYKPSLEAIERSLRDRGSMTDWTGSWQGSTPEVYLKGVNRLGSTPGLIGRFIEEALPW